MRMQKSPLFQHVAPLLRLESFALILMFLIGVSHTVSGQACPDVSGVWVISALNSKTTNVYSDGSSDIDESTDSGQFNAVQSGCSISLQSADPNHPNILVVRSGTISGNTVTFPASQNKIFSDP